MRLMLLRKRLRLALLCTGRDWSFVLCPSLMQEATSVNYKNTRSPLTLALQWTTVKVHVSSYSDQVTPHTVSGQGAVM